MPIPSEGSDQPSKRRARVPIILRAMRDTYELIESAYPSALDRPREASAVLAANVYFLLSNAYKRRRLAGTNRTYEYKVAAMTAAAIMIVRPLRYLRATMPEEELLQNANMDCATRAATSLLDIDLSKVDPDFVRRLHRATLGPIDLPCLSPYLQQFDKVIFAAEYMGGSAFDDIEAAIPFAPFNTVSLGGREMIQIENLLNVFLLMKLAKNALRGD
jgi:hypothetical protein